MGKKYLVALDGSKAAMHALNYAITLAEVTNAELELLTVVPPVFLPSYSIYVLKSEAISDCAKELEISFRGVLSKALNEIRKTKPELKVSTKFEKGEPYARIVETAKEGKFDLIIMGRRGAGGRATVLGSVSCRVIDESPCPVLIVK